MFYKIQMGVVVGPGHTEPLVTTTRSSRHVNCSTYKVPFYRTTHHQTSFFLKTIRNWNKLTDSVSQVQKPSKAGCGATFVIDADQMFYIY